MKKILIFLFICFGFALNSQITITCYECKKNTTVDCKGCNIQSSLFTGIVIKEKGKPDIPLYEPYKVSNKSNIFTFEDAFGTKTIVNVTSVLSYNTPKKLYDYLSNCLCKPSTIDTDTDIYSSLVQDSILVTYNKDGVEISRDTIRVLNNGTDTKTTLVQDSILVYYDIQNNEIGRDTIKIPFVDTDIQTYLTQDSILVYYDETNTEIGRDTISIPNITEQGNFRISNDTLYHNNSIDGIEQFVTLPSIDTTTQSYLPILNGTDTIGYENITYLGGVEVDRDTFDYQLWYEKRICLNTATPAFTPADPNNPTLTEVEAWKNANLSLLDQQNGTILTYFVDGDGGSCEDPDFIWVLNKGSELITLLKNRVKQSWVKELNLEQYSNRELLKSDNIYHEGKVSVGTDQFITEYIQNINGNEYINGIQNSNFDYNRTNTFSSISVNPLTGNDSVDPSLRPSTPFATLAAAVNFINSSSATGRNTITITGTTVATPLNTGSFNIFRGKAIDINANGQFINITGTINNYGIMVLNYGTYNFTGNNRIINFYTAGFYCWLPTFNLSPTHTTVHFLFRVGSTGVFDFCNINYTGNNTAFFASENNTSILLFSSTFNNGGFTGLMLCRGLFNTYSHNNTCSLTHTSWDSLSSQNIDVSNVTIWNDNRIYQGFTTLPLYATLTANKVNISGGNLKFFNLPAFDNDASATIPIGTIYQTSATNTLGLPQGVIMIKQ